MTEAATQPDSQQANGTH